jgi:hypothetical protein
MKARAGNYLAVLLLVFAFTGTAIAQSDSESCLKIYETPKAKIRAGFIPYKAQIVLGEPLQVTFSVGNLGPTNFAFWFGGDYRGTGRHDRFKVAVTNANGEALTDYREAPPNLKEQAKAELMDEVRIFSQNYHAGTVEFVESAKKIFTAQLEQILK